jgi:hypothetical protein
MRTRACVRVQPSERGDDTARACNTKHPAPPVIARVRCCAVAQPLRSSRLGSGASTLCRTRSTASRSTSASASDARCVPPGWYSASSSRSTDAAPAPRASLDASGDAYVKLNSATHAGSSTAGRLMADASVATTTSTAPPSTASAALLRLAAMFTSAPAACSCTPRWRVCTRSAAMTASSAPLEAASGLSESSMKRLRSAPQPHSFTAACVACTRSAATTASSAAAPAGPPATAGVRARYHIAPQAASATTATSACTRMPATMACRPPAAAVLARPSDTAPYGSGPSARSARQPAVCTAAVRRCAHIHTHTCASRVRRRGRGTNSAYAAPRASSATPSFSMASRLAASCAASPASVHSYANATGSVMQARSACAVLRGAIRRARHLGQRQRMLARRKGPTGEEGVSGLPRVVRRTYSQPPPLPEPAGERRRLGTLLAAHALRRRRRWRCRCELFSCCLRLR